MPEFDASGYFLSVEDMGTFLNVFVPYVGWGLGLAASFWALGHVAWFIVDALRF